MSRIIDGDAVLDRYYAEFEKQDICDGHQDREWLMQCLEEAPTLGLPDVTLYIESANFQGLGTTLYAAENVSGYKKGEAVQIYGTKYENFRSYFLIWSKEYNGWRWYWATFFTPIPRGGEDV